MAIQTLSGELYDKTEVESIKTELTEKIDTIIITGGGVSPTVFEEAVTRLEETDSTINAAILTLQETDATINDRVTALEAGGGSGGSTTDLTVVNERLTALEAEDDATIARVVALENKDLTLTDSITALQEADVIIDEQVTALQEADLSINEQVTALQEADVSINERVAALEAGGSTSAEDKSLVIKLSVINPEALDDGIAISNLQFAEETSFNDLFEKAKTGGYNVTVNLIVDKDDSSTVYYSAKPAQLQAVTEDTDGKPLIFCDVVFGQVSEVLTNFIYIKSDINGNCIIESGSGKDEFQVSKLASGDAVDALAERVTALEENGSGGGSTDDLSSYTYIIDSQEKFDAFCTVTNATEADGNDYSHVLIKNGNYTIIEGHAIRLDNEAVPILSITGESQEGVVITIQATYGLYVLNIDNVDTQITKNISNCTFVCAESSTAYVFYHVSNVHFCTVNYSRQSNASPAVKGYVFYCSKDITDCTVNLLQGNDVTIFYNTDTTNTTVAHTDTSNRNNILVASSSVLKKCNIQSSGVLFLSENSTVVDSNINVNEFDVKGCSWNTKYINCVFIAAKWSFSITHGGEIIKPFFTQDSFQQVNIIIDDIDCYVAGSIQSAPIAKLISNSNNIDKVQVSITKLTPSGDGKPLIHLFNACTNIQNTSYYVEEVFKQKATVYGFVSCTNLNNCTNAITDTKVSKNTCVFHGCTNLSNCTTQVLRPTYYQGYTTSATEYNLHIHLYYYKCTKLTNCTAILNTTCYDSVDSDSGTTYYGQNLKVYNECTDLVNCTVDLQQLTLTSQKRFTLCLFMSCTNLNNCGHTGVTDTKAFTINGATVTELSYTEFSKCTNITNYCSAIFTSFYSGNTTYYHYNNNITYTESAETSTLWYTLFSSCKNISNCDIAANTSSNSTTNLLKLSKTTATTDRVYAFNNCSSLVNIRCLVRDENDSKLICCTNGIQNCMLGSVDTASCSAAQTYMADYTVADTPAGGFNKIL